MSYPNPIPQTAQLADAAALAAAPNHGAPAIAAGAAIALLNVTNASNETATRRNLKAMGYVVSDDELAQSIVREHAVISHHAATTGGGVTNAALLAAINAMSDNINAMNDNINARIDLLEAIQFNIDARLFNGRVQDGTPLRMLRKQHVGLLPVGNPMFGAAAPTFFGPPANVNTVLPLQAAVTTVNDLNNLTMQQISDLARQAGTDFGIVAGDPVAARRWKIVRYFGI